MVKRIVRGAQPYIKKVEENIDPVEITSHKKDVYQMSTPNYQDIDERRKRVLR
jgi:PHD/YefM family antitoxin component YafN of YafNO toxin-antitoxin module